jgi:Zn-dependent peptidase ImmA (M78 family)|tara:strand:+ start:7979 stop:8287 length:309 start_codon:yes stop_codon:yes gene_type:complete
MARKRANKNFKFKNADGVEYEIIFRKPDKRTNAGVHGLCYHPDDKKPRIYINPYLTNQSELNTIIHEIAHAFFWNKTEKEIAKFANTCSRFLYNKGKWRKEE